MDFAEVGVSEERARELKEKREASQTLAHDEAASAAPPPQLEKPFEAITTAELMLYIDEYCESMAEVEGFQRPPAFLQKSTAASTAALAKRLEINFDSIPTWALVLAASTSAFCFFLPGILCLVKGPPPKKEDPVTAAELRAKAIAAELERRGMKVVGPPPGGA